MAFKMKGFSGFKQTKGNNPARTFGTKFQEEKPIKLNPRGTNIRLPKSTVDKPMNYGMRKTFSKVPPPPSTGQKITNILKKHPAYVIGTKISDYAYDKLKNLKGSKKTLYKGKVKRNDKIA
tara:strand:+ start:94 stop:456 length:363 start_codon:yes stop_codon:yes gene_type:complete